MRQLFSIHIVLYTCSKFISMIQGFLSVGLTKTQYKGFMEATSIGSVEHPTLTLVTDIDLLLSYMYYNGNVTANINIARP